MQSLECPSRVDVLCGLHGILHQEEQGFGNEKLVLIEKVEREASLADVLRVHEWEYVYDLMGYVRAYVTARVKCSWGLRLQI